MALREYYMSHSSSNSAIKNSNIEHTNAFFFFFFFIFLSFRAVPTEYGSSQARGQIGAVAAGLFQSHSTMGSELHLEPKPQLMATPDP